MADAAVAPVGGPECGSGDAAAAGSDAGADVLSDVPDSDNGTRADGQLPAAVLKRLLKCQCSVNIQTLLKLHLVSFSFPCRRSDSTQ